MGRSYVVLALASAVAVGVVASPAAASTAPNPPFTCRTSVADIDSRPGNRQIIEPIHGTTHCTGVFIRQSVTVILQVYKPRGVFLPGRWEQVTSRSARTTRPGAVNVSTRWNCGDPHRNDAGRVRLRVVASGWVLTEDGVFGASARSANEITRDCAV